MFFYNFVYVKLGNNNHFLSLETVIIYKHNNTTFTVDTFHKENDMWTCTNESTHPLQLLTLFYAVCLYNRELPGSDILCKSEINCCETNQIFSYHWWVIAF